MESVFVGAGGHAGGAAEGFIGVHGQIFDADGAEAAGMGAERGENLLRLRRGGRFAVPSAPVSLASFS